MKGMESPMEQREIRKVLDEKHKGFLEGKEFAFEVFDNTGTTKLFATRFNATEKIPAEGYESEHLVATSFCWSFDLREELQPLARKAFEEYLASKH